MAEAELPKQELLVKLLKMTSSSNDGEALTAMRKANALLASAGWDWDRLIAGKIKVVADPFANMTRPAPRPQAAPQPAHPAHQPTPQYKPTPQPQARTLWTSHQFPNKFAGFCHCCGTDVPATKGFYFKHTDYQTASVSAYGVMCSLCNVSRNNHPLPRYAVAAQRKRGKAAVSDLA